MQRQSTATPQRCVVCKADTAKGTVHSGRDTAGCPTPMFVCADCEKWAASDGPASAGRPPKSGLAFFLRTTGGPV
jgi:hypothetical protein